MRSGMAGGAIVLALLLVTAAPAQRSRRSRPKPPPPAAKPEPKPLPPFNVAVARRITVDDIKRMMEEGTTFRFVDVRSSFTGTRIQGSDHVPESELAAWSRSIPKETFLVTYCTCSAEHTSASAVLKLQQAGFTNAFALKGGLSAWQGAELPTDVQP